VRPKSAQSRRRCCRTALMPLQTSGGTHKAGSGTLTETEMACSSMRFHTPWCAQYLAFHSQRQLNSSGTCGPCSTLTGLAQFPCVNSRRETDCARQFLQTWEFKGQLMGILLEGQSLRVPLSWTRLPARGQLLHRLQVGRALARKRVSPCTRHVRGAGGRTTAQANATPGLAEKMHDLQQLALLLLSLQGNC